MLPLFWFSSLTHLGSNWHETAWDKTLKGKKQTTAIRKWISRGMISFFFFPLLHLKVFFKWCRPRLQIASVLGESWNDRDLSLGLVRNIWGERYILPPCQSCSQPPQRYSPPKSLKLKVKGIYRQSATSIWKAVNRIWAGPWARSGIVWRPTLGLPSRPCLLLYLSSTHTFTFSPAVTCASSIHSSRAGELGQVDLLSVRTHNWSDLTGHGIRSVSTASSLLWNGQNFVCSAFNILPSATVKRSQTKSHCHCGCEHHHPFISGPALMLDLKLANK